MLLGRLTRAEKQLACFLGLLSFLGISHGDGGYVFFPLILIALTLGPWATVVGGAMLSVIPLGCGSSPFLIGISCAALVRGFRTIYHQESVLARDRQAMLKTLVHELRNPLFAAKGTIDNLSSRFHELDEKSLEIQLGMASEAMQCINQEVDDLTQLLHLESGRLVARPEKVTMEKIFRKLRRRFPAETLEHHTLYIEGEKCELTCDSLLMLQTLDKLVSNAIVHAPGGIISIVARSNPKGHQIVVTDEGPGIPAEKRHEVFQRFTQMGTSSIGFGLGLYLARQYVLAQRGELTLEESETGCHFKIWLPRVLPND
jgi:signal transduction histidine kinase